MYIHTYIIYTYIYTPKNIHIIYNSEYMYIYIYTVLQIYIHIYKHIYIHFGYIKNGDIHL